MRKLLLASLICLGSFCSFAAGRNEYVIDDLQVEQLFTNSVDVSLSAVSEANLINAAAGMNPGKASYYKGSDKSFAAAIILNFFLGVLGIHRLYLGTETLTWVGYILTCGGIFGVVPLVDFIILIVDNEDISEFVDNPKFFMWG